MFFRPLSMNVKRLSFLFKKEREKKNGGWWENDLIFSLNTQIFCFVSLSPAGRPPHHNIQGGLKRRGWWRLLVFFFGLCLKGPETQCGPLYREDFLSLSKLYWCSFLFFLLSMSFIILFSLVLKLKRVQLTIVGHLTLLFYGSCLFWSWHCCDDVYDCERVFSLTQTTMAV